jgi:hypothetical protein
VPIPSAAPRSIPKSDRHLVKITKNLGFRQTLVVRLSLMNKKQFHTALYLVYTACAHAVILAGGDGTQNTTAPAGGQGWDYVGRITSQNGAPSSVTYISNNWFITAYHIKHYDNPTGVLLGGSAYDIDPNSWTRMQNSIGGDADLIMFRVVGGTVGLPALTVRSFVTLPNSSLTMIGNGRNRETSESHWDVNKFTSPWTWSAVSPPPPADYSGYKWASAGSAKRWGTNKMETSWGLTDYGFGATDLFYTDFDNSNGEAQGATYDSGGGVFYNNGGDWELAGIMLYAPTYSGQPAGTSVYGNPTLAADMQYYAAQINSTAEIDDLDGDGIPDGWEYAQAGSSTGVVAGADQDGDGFNGEEEWLADTAPLDARSYLHLTDCSATNLFFTSSSNRQYQVQSVDTLTNSNWALEVNWFDGMHSQTVQSVSAIGSNRFFRVRARLP